MFKTIIVRLIQRHATYAYVDRGQARVIEGVHFNKYTVPIIYRSYQNGVAVRARLDKGAAYS